MLRAKEEGYDFSLTVNEMEQLNTVFLSNFSTDKAEFIAKVPDLNHNFLDDWKLNTTSLDTIESDSDFIDTQLLLTRAIDELMTTGRDILQTVYFYVERTYSGNKAILSYFGKDRYEDARKTAPKLHDLMLKTKDACEKQEYKNELTAKGLTQVMIDDLSINAANLKDKYDEREVYMSSRKLATQQRVKLLNRIWQSMSMVSDAAKLVYKDNYAKQQQYLLYTAKTKAKEDKTDPITTA